MQINRSVSKSVIKSIQRGFFEIAPNTAEDLAIAPVDIAKSSLKISFRNGYTRGQATSNGDDNYVSTSISGGGYLHDPTTIRLRGGRGFSYSGTANYDVVIYWEVIEYV